MRLLIWNVQRRPASLERARATYRPDVMLVQEMPRHNDYISLSEDLEASVRDVRVGPIDHELSDHAPIVLDL